MDAKPRARKRSQYNPNKHRKGTFNRGPFDDKTLRPDANAQVVRPKWKSKALWFRPLPALCPEDPSRFDPFYLADEDQLSLVIYAVPCAKWVGSVEKGKITFITHNRVWEETVNYNPRLNNPYYVAFYNLVDAMREGRSSTGKGWKPEWNQYIRDPKSQVNKANAVFTAPKAVGFSPGLVYQNDDKSFVKDGMPFGAHPDDPLPVIQISSAATDAFIGMATIQNEGYDGDEKDLENAFKYGDWVHPDFGRFIAIYHPKYANFDKGTSLSEGVGHGGDHSKFVGYEVKVSKVFKCRETRQKFTPELSGDLLDAVKPKIQFIEDLLNCPGPDPNQDELDAHHHNIAMMMARAYRNASKMLLYAWDEGYDFVDSEVLGILGNRKQVSVTASVDDEPQSSVETSQAPFDSLDDDDDDLDDDFEDDDGLDLDDDDPDDDDEDDFEFEDDDDDPPDLEEEMAATKSDVKASMEAARERARKRSET